MHQTVRLPGHAETRRRRAGRSCPVVWAGQSRVRAVEDSRVAVADSPAAGAAVRRSRLAAVDSLDRSHTAVVADRRHKTADTGCYYCRALTSRGRRYRCAMNEWDIDNARKEALACVLIRNERVRKRQSGACLLLLILGP